MARSCGGMPTPSFAKASCLPTVNRARTIEVINGMPCSRSIATRSTIRAWSEKTLRRSAPSSSRRRWLERLGLPSNRHEGLPWEEKHAPATGGPINGAVVGKRTDSATIGGRVVAAGRMIAVVQTVVAIRGRDSAPYTTY